MTEDINIEDVLEKITALMNNEFHGICTYMYMYTHTHTGVGSIVHTTCILECVVVVMTFRTPSDSLV